MCLLVGKSGQGNAPRGEVLMAKQRVCVIPGDDAAPEVVRPTVQLLDRMQLGIEFVWLTTGEEAVRRSGEGFPPAAKTAVDEAACTLFGSTRDPRTSGLAYLRWGKKTYANFRPVKWMTGMRSPLKRPDGIDFVIVRENLEGLYPGREGYLAQLAPLKLTDPMTLQVLDTSKKGKFAVRVITEENTRSIARAGCGLAMKRKANGEVPYLAPQRVKIDDRVNLLQRPVLPHLHVGAHRLGHLRHQGR